jgi:hypothetical protein
MGINRRSASVPARDIARAAPFVSFRHSPIPARIGLDGTNPEAMGAVIHPPLGVQSQGVAKRIWPEPLWLFRPDFADVPVGHEEAP